MSEASPFPAPKKSRKLLWIGLVLFLLLGAGGGGGAWFMLQPKGAQAAKPAKPKKQLFTTLEPFTVNLQDPRGERFAQIGLTLQYDDPQIEIVVTDRLPTVRNDILLLLAAKQIEELLTPEGKQQLAAEIRTTVGRVVAGEAMAAPAAAASAPGAGKAPANPIHAVLFSQFIVQ